MQERGVLHSYLVTLAVISSGCAFSFLAISFGAGGISKARLLFFIAFLALGFGFVFSSSRLNRAAWVAKVSATWKKEQFYKTALILLAAAAILLTLFLKSVWELGESNSLLAIRLLPFAVFADLACLSTVFYFLKFGRRFHQKWLKELLSLSPTTIALIGYLVGFAIIFLPTFLFQAGQLNFPEPVVSSEPIGDDLRKFLAYSTSTLLDGHYTGNYPPFPLLFFFPLSKIELHTAYQWLTVATFVSLIYVAFVFPAKMTSAPGRLSAISLVGLTSLLSYGLHWELENGQFNIIALALSLFGVFLFHHRPERRKWAYLLVSLGLQLKLWPGIFVLLLIRQKDTLSTAARRIGLLLAINFAALFVLGPRIFFSFVDGLVGTRQNYLWTGNHSIESFVTMLGLEPSAKAALSLLVLVVVIVLIAVVLRRAWRARGAGVNPHLLLALTIGALVIPSISNDYKLPVLAPALSIFLISGGSPKDTGRKSIFYSLVLLISLSYSITTFSLGLRPPLLDNSFPLLFGILAFTTMAYLLQGKKD